MAVATGFIAIALYSYAFYCLWRGFNSGNGVTELPADLTSAQNDQGPGGSAEPATPANLATSLRIIILSALTCHFVTTYLHLFTETGLNLSLLSVSNLVMWIAVTVVALGAIRLPVEKLLLFLFPLSVAVLALLNLTNSSRQSIEDLSVALVTHILLSLAAYSTLFMAACQSILLAVQERNLKTPGKQILKLLPPLETMERLLLMMLWVGLILLTASIASGFIFLDNMFAQHVVHHTVLSSASWLLYASFLCGHYLMGWRGLTAVKWTLCAFALLVLGYLGSKFVLEYILER